LLAQCPKEYLRDYLPEGKWNNPTVDRGIDSCYNSTTLKQRRTKWERDH
jgi:hypothetical protein